MNEIPAALLPQIFGCLSDRWLFTVGLHVCRMWNQSRARWETLISELGQTPRFLSKKRKCEAYAVRHLTITKADVALWITFPNLTSIELRDPLTEHELATICTHCPLLEDLDVFVDATDTALACLSSLESLKNLSLAANRLSRFTSRAWNSLGEVGSLRQLTLYRYELLEGIDALRKLPHFERLYVIECIFSCIVLEQLSTCRELRHLRFTGEFLRDAHLRSMRAMPRLDTLELCRPATGTFFQAWSGFTALQTVRIFGSMTDRGVQALCAALPWAKALEFYGCKGLTIHSLRAVTSLITLRYLAMTNCALTDDDVSSITVPRSIEHLDFEGVKHLSGASLKHVWHDRLRTVTWPVKKGDDLTWLIDTALEKLQLVDAESCFRFSGSPLQLREYLIDNVPPKRV